jgi:hypothetical protein
MFGFALVRLISIDQQSVDSMSTVRIIELGGDSFFVS